MARNDVVLLDSLLEKSRAQYSVTDTGELFELFCFDHLLKDYDPSYEDLEDGWTDAGDDGGIDGFFVVLDDIILTDTPDFSVRRTPNIDLFLISAKHAANFRQAPVNALISSLPEILDLSKPSDELKYPFASDVLDQRDLFKELYVSLAERHPRLRVHVIYASRGDASRMPENITSRADVLKDELSHLFSDAEISFRFAGAGELLDLARKRRTHSLRLRFIEGNISRASADYVMLCLLEDYFLFVTDEQGQLRRYLFESNVRDYLGEFAINRDIAETLRSNERREQMDFWWLNNGVTLLASAATIAGKELTMENVQIVNGLQTTETIYRHFRREDVESDDRAILVKVLVTTDDSVRDRIIKATNYQNMVDLASLRGTDRIQRDIEHYLGDNGWFYDRRKGFYKNQGKPSDRIISISYLGAAVQSIALRQFSVGFRGKTKWLRNDDIYGKVFDEKWDLEVFLVCLELAKHIETHLGRVGWRKGNRYTKRAMALAIASVWAAQMVQKPKFHPNDLAQLKGCLPTSAQVREIWTDLGEIRVGGKKQVKGLASRVNSLCNSITGQ